MAKSPAWQRKEGTSKSGGLNAKGVASYRKANPGSKLKPAVTTKPPSVTLTRFAAVTIPTASTFVTSSYVTVPPTDKLPVIVTPPPI